MRLLPENIARRQLKGFLSLAVLLGVVGCGDGPGDMTLIPSTGQVTLDGKPLADADLEFFPIGEKTRGFGGSARTDAEGKFSAMSPPGKPGLPAGEYGVVISKRVLPPGAPTPAPDAPPVERADRETLPPWYSDRAEWERVKLTFTVPDTGTASKDFPLTSKFKR